MNKVDLLKKTTLFVNAKLAGAEAVHDWWHIERVRNTALQIGKVEQGDLLVIELGALLHDIADSKFHDGDEEVGPEIALKYLNEVGVEDQVKSHVINIIRNISFRKSKEKREFDSLELRILQDADRLDAIGAIGIARAFNYGGFKNRAFYDPEIPPMLEMTKDQYKNSTSPTINHFYEKLLLLKGMMNTVTGEKMAADRHEFMEHYLQQFYDEWNGKA